MDRYLQSGSDLVRKKANEFAERLNVTNFDANNGFITRFVKRHDLKYESKSGESESVNEDIVIEWKKSLKEKYNSYEPKNIFNIDETGIFWRLLQNKTYSLPEESAKGYKKIKDRITVLFLVNMDGSERLIVVIGKYKNPRCFKGIKNFPIWLYLHNRTAWMTSETFNEIMLKLDKRMRKQNRNILVFLDNCASHPFLNLNNIKLLFLPPNTTSRLQTLDAGIIRSFKQRYRNRMLEYIIEILDGDEDQDCEQAVKSVTLLKAIYIMDSSIRSIPESVFINCFKECGFEYEFDQNDNSFEEQLFSANNWEQINERLNTGFNDFNEMVSFDDNIVCRQDLTEDEIIEIVRPLPEATNDSSDTEIDESQVEVISLDKSLKIPSNYEALNGVFELRLYLGSLEEVDNSYYDLLNKFENLILENKKSQKQSLITDYFAKTN